MSELRGKYVILDFWASWCAPCRASNPHLIELWNKYHEKGFEIVCVADDDDSRDAWHNAIEKDGIGMFYHVLRGLKKDANDPRKYDTRMDVSKAYAVHFLPTKYLIDPEGKIIGKFNDDELEVKLKEIFGE